MFCHFLFDCLKKTCLGATAALQGLKTEMAVAGGRGRPKLSRA